MKITFNSKTMASVLSGMIKVIQEKCVLQSMLNYKFEVQRDVMTIIAMNTRCCVLNKIEVQSDIEDEYVFCINAGMFNSFINKIDGEIEMTFKGNKAYLKHQYGKLSLSYTEADNFPAVVYPKEYKSFWINGSLLSMMISDVATSAGSDVTDKPILASVCLDSEAGTLTVAATDQFNMKVYSTPIDRGDDFKALASPYIADVMKQYVKGKEVEVRYDGTRTYFVCDDTYIYDINAEGKYPNYMNIVNVSKEGNDVEVLGSSLKGCVDRLYALSFGFVKIKKEGDGLHITSKNKIEDGEIDEQVPVLNESNDMEGYFNVSIFRDMLKCIKSENVTLKFADRVRCMRIEENVDNVYKILLTMQVSNIEF